MIATTKANGIEPYRYLRPFFAEMKRKRASDLKLLG
ncbi:MAG: hypothetical protein AAGI44_06080 [Pseudomonadota bacterium]